MALLTQPVVRLRALLARSDTRAVKPRIYRAALGRIAQMLRMKTDKSSKRFAYLVQQSRLAISVTTRTRSVNAPPGLQVREEM